MLIMGKLGVKYENSLDHPPNFSVNLNLFSKILKLIFKIFRYIYVKKLM